MATINNSRAVILAPQIKESAPKYEEEHVHAVYDEIASHFSSTRYKPWPIVGNFMASLAQGSVGLDLGCGNGKYLGLPSEEPSRIKTIGVDRSRNLLTIAQKVGKNGNEVVLGDVIDIPWRQGAFDYAISIATIHHLVTSSRRVQAVEASLRAVSPQGGRILIYVWAVEQDTESKRVIPKEPNDEIISQSNSQTTPAGVDVLVPWVHNAAKSSSSSEKPRVYQRYYHMFAEGELRTLVIEAAQNLGLVIGDASQYREGKVKGIQFVQEGWERSNYYVELLLWEKN